MGMSDDNDYGKYTAPVVEDGENGIPAECSTGSDELHRKLRSREVQLLAVGGAIGTCMYLMTVDLVCDTDNSALFVQMGAALPKGGPAGLFIGFLAYGTIVLAVNECFGW